MNPELLPIESTGSQQASTKKQNATLAQRIEILDWHYQSPSKNQTKTAAHWDKIYPSLQLKQPTISSWLKEEGKWRAQWAEAQSQGHDGRKKRRKQAEFPDVDGMVELGVSKTVGGGAVGGEVLREMWVKFANLEKVSEEERPGLSTGWIEGLKKRCGLEGHSEAGPEKGQSGDVEAECARIRAVVAQHNYALKDIFNLDETGLFYAMPPDCRSVDEQLRSKAVLTYALAVNANGSEKLPPFIIGKVARPRAFLGKTSAELGVYYRSNALAWMTIKLYQEWLSDWDQKLQKEGRHVLLLQDNFGVHIPPDNLTNIKVETFMLDDTAQLQPNEAGIIRCFKALYRTKFYSRAMDRFDSGISSEHMYEINQLEAMRIVETAWQDVDTVTIHNCWRKTGILPDLMFGSVPPVTMSSHTVNSDQISDAEKALSDTLERLQTRYVLQKDTTLAVEDLVNSSNEMDLMMKTTTDEDICAAVKEMRRGEQMREVNCGDDGVNLPEECRPSRKEALDAVRTLQRYLLDVNEPYARELETELANFGKQTRHQLHTLLR